MSADRRIATLLAEGRWVLDPARYLMVGLDPGRSDAIARLAETGSFFAAVRDDLETTLFVDLRGWQKVQIVTESEPLPVRLVTFEAELPADLIGFMALISRALADASISVLPLAANRRDHLFVAEADADRALAILEALR